MEGGLFKSEQTVLGQMSESNSLLARRLCRIESVEQKFFGIRSRE
jgi:hypothetical protein